MSRKVVLIFLLGLIVPTIATIQNVNGTWYIRGWIGKYLEIGHIAIDPWTLEFKVNETATFEIFLQNLKDLYVKTIDVWICVADAKYNETLAKDMLWEKPSDALAGAIYKLVTLTPRQDGLVSLYIHACYQYTEGNQTMEHEGTFELVNVASVFSHTYTDLLAENGDLNNEVYGLNSSIQSLNASYSTLQAQVYFLALTSFTLFVITLLAGIAYRRKKPLEHESQRAVA